MMKMEGFGKLAVLLTLLVLPISTSIQAEHQINAEDVIRAKIDERSQRGRHCKERRVKPIKLRDFAGDWAISFVSVGGVTGPTEFGIGPLAVGTSEILNGIILFDEKGIGSLQFLQGAIYEGDRGDFTFPDLSNEPFDIVLTLVDDVKGIANLTFTTSVMNAKIDANFVIIRSKENGRPLKLQGHPIFANSGQTSLTAINMERQFQ